MERLTRAQRASDKVTEFCGSWTFIIVFSALTFGWIILNSFLLLFGVWDIYPYILLNLVLTVVSTFQSPLIMMSQNRQIERDKQAAKVQEDLDRELIKSVHAKLDELKELLGRD